jgi:uncharacterized protein (TIGR00661 family)
VKILYGVVGEGMGHAVRSRVVIEHLIGQGHDVRVVASGRAHGFLEARFPSVGEIWGLTMAYSDNEVRRWQTVARNLTGAVSGWPRNVREYFRIVEDFAPEVVVSDFESFSWLFARRHRIPVISVDNIQMIDRARQPEEITEGREIDFELARTIVRTKLPGCAHYVVTTFFFPPLRRRRTTLVPPILRPEILAAVPEDGDHLLVYQTAEGNEALPEALAACGVPCRVYGMRRDLTEDVREGDVVYRPFSEAGFIEDLRTARAVLTGGGFTLMSECVHLGKPTLSVPVGGQFEQVMNARWLERLGYGAHAEHATPAAIGDLLARVDACRAALAGFDRAGNGPALAAVDAALAEALNR